jgi:hypothetical protein
VTQAILACAEPISSSPERNNESARDAAPGARWGGRRRRRPRPGAFCRGGPLWPPATPSARGSPAHLQRVIGRVRAAPLLASAWPERGAGCAGTHSRRSERRDGERPAPTRDPSARTRVRRPATTPPDDIARAAASRLKWPACVAGVSLTCLDKMGDVDRRGGSRAPDDGSRAPTRCLTSDPKKPAPARSLPSLVRGVWCASATGWVMRAGEIPRAASPDSSRAGSRCLSPRTRFLHLRC